MIKNTTTSIANVTTERTPPDHSFSKLSSHWDKIFRFGKIVLLILLVIVLVFVGNILFASGGNYRKIQLLVVVSGSMLPTLEVGSVIVVMPPIKTESGQPIYSKGEIITFTNGKETFTHRVVKSTFTNDQFFYQTKGDFNKGEDVSKTPEKNISGKVYFHLAYVGYMLTFVKSQNGIMLFIIIPVILIVYQELEKNKRKLLK